MTSLPNRIHPPEKMCMNSDAFLFHDTSYLLLYIVNRPGSLRPEVPAGQAWHEKKKTVGIRSLEGDAVRSPPSPVFSSQQVEGGTAGFLKGREP